VTTILASGETTVTGEYATTALTQGSLLTPADLTTTQVPAPGQLLVPVQLKQGQLPARGLADGATVIITPVQASQAQDTQPALAQPVQATAEEASQPDQNGMVTVDLLVSTQYATEVAQQAASQGIALLIAPAQGLKE
jgi:hypothetical protein